jgi:hypothetical protein
LHGIDARVGGTGNQPGLLQGVAGATQAGHLAGKTVELGAAKDTPFQNSTEATAHSKAGGTVGGYRPVHPLRRPCAHPALF